MKVVPIVLAAVFAFGSAATNAQGWSPQKNVEIVAASPPGGSIRITSAPRCASCSTSCAPTVNRAPGRAVRAGVLPVSVV